MATPDVHKPYDKNSRKRKKDTSTDEPSVTKLPENLQLLCKRLDQVVSLVEPVKEEIVQLWEQRSFHQKSQEKLESQLHEAKNENAKLEKRMMEIGRDTKCKAELQQANVKIQALENMLKEKDDLRIEEITAYKEVNRNTEELHKKALQDVEETKCLQETEFKKETGVRNKKRSIFAEGEQDLKAKKDELETEITNNKTGLSKLMSDKLPENNQDTAELSDENRPTRIGEKFQELYDNQWTDAYEVAQKHFSNKDEEARILVLRRILMDIHELCEKEHSEQENALVQALYRTDKVVKDQLTVAIKTQLKDLKLRVAKDDIENITQKFLESGYKATLLENFILEVKDFVHECVMICWLMVLQDPPLCFHTDVSNGEVFDSNKYKAFTSARTFIDFIVWPPLLLHKNGPVLTKGIAQCKEQFDGSITVRSLSPRILASEKSIRTGSVRLKVKHLQNQLDRNNRIHESFEEEVNTTMSDKKSNDLVTVTDKRLITIIQVRYNSQTHAANVHQNKAYPRPHQSSQQI